MNSLWVLMCAALVFAMQGGFLCLESGLTRSKNVINVAIKNMTNFSVSLLLFWAFGFALMFGTSLAGWIGTDYFFAPLSAKDLGGLLSVYSGGPGQGARHTLNLPIHANEVAACT